MAQREYSMYSQLTSKITAAVLATVIVVALLVPVVMSVSTEYTSAYNSGTRYSTDLDGEHQIEIGKTGVTYSISTDGGSNPSPTFIDTSVGPQPDQRTVEPLRSPTRGELLRATQTWTSGDCTCTLDTDTGVFTVSGNGAMQDYSSANNRPWVSVINGIKSQVIEPGVTNVGGRCFQSCSNLASVTIPDTVTSVGAAAFTFCTSLTSIIFEATTWNITSIGSLAFALGSSSASVTANVYSPNNVANGQLDSYKNSYTTLNYSAFPSWTSGDCTCTLNPGTGEFVVSGTGQMQDYTPGSPAPWISDTTQKDAITSIVVQSGVTKIGNNCFNGCTSLESVTIPSGVTSINRNAFYNCTSLASVTIPDSVTSIGFGAFSYCTSLASITIPSSVTSIENTTFSYCTSLASVTIPDSVTSIGINAFLGCDSLASVTIPSSVTSIGDNAFGGCTGLTSIIFESTTWNITSIGNGAFSLGTSATPVTATVYSPGNIANGQLDSYKGSYTTLVYQGSPSTVTINVNDPAYGSVSQSTVTNVPFGTSVSASGNVLTIGSTDVTATAQLGYRFASWTGIPQGGTITEDTTITAVFELDVYTVTIAVNDPTYGTVDVQTIPNITPGTAVTISDNTMTIGSTTVTATPAQATAQYTYAFSQWANAPASITQDVTITATFTATVNQYTVTVNVNDSNYGSVSPASVTVDYGSVISVSGNVLTVGSTSVTQTPATATAQYTYSFDSWTGTAATVTGDMTVTANFTRATNDYTVTITVNDANYGSVSQSSVTVPYGTAVSTAQNVLTVGSTTVTASPASPTMEWMYAFDSWTGVPQSVTDDVTVTAVFTQSPRVYTVTITVNDPTYGTVDLDSVTVDYGASISAASNVLTVNGTDITATANPQSAQYTFAFGSWSNVPAGGTVTDDLTVTANFTATLRSYTVTIMVNDVTQGSVDVSSVTADYGTTMTANGNVLTVNTSPATVVTATPSPATAQYTYQFTQWQNITPIDGDRVVVAQFTRITNEYTVTFVSGNSEYGSVSEDTITALYGSSVVVDGNMVRISSYECYAYANEPTAQYTYSFVDWTGAPATVTGDVTITANFSRTVNQYTVQIVSNNTDYGTVDVGSVTVDYGTAVTYSSNVLTIGSNTVTATPTASTPTWTYIFSEWQNAPLAVTGNVTVTAVFTATHLVYTVSFQTNGGTPVADQEIEGGQTATRPADPFCYSYYLLNWYTDSELTVPYSFNTPVNADVTLYQGYAPDRYAMIAYGSDSLLVLFDHSGALVYVGGEGGYVHVASVTQGSSYTLVLTDGEYTAGEETVKVMGYMSPSGDLAYGQNQLMNADSPFSVFGVLNTTTQGGSDIQFAYCVTGTFNDRQAVVASQTDGDDIAQISCAQEIVDARVDGATVSIVTDTSETGTYANAYILAPYEIRTYNPDYVGDTLATLLMAIAVFCVLGIIAMVGYNKYRN